MEDANGVVNCYKSLTNFILGSFEDIEQNMKKVLDVDLITTNCPDALCQYGSTLRFFGLI